MDRKHCQNGAQRIDNSKASASNPTREQLQYIVDKLSMKNDRLSRQYHELLEEKHVVLVEAKKLRDENQVLEDKLEGQSTRIYYLYQRIEELELVLREKLNV